MSRNSKAAAWVLVLAPAVFILVLDLASSWEDTWWLLYIFPVVFASRLTGRKTAYIFTALCSALIIVDLLYSPPTIQVSTVLVNRFIFIGVLFFATKLVLDKKESELLEQAGREKLELYTKRLNDVLNAVPALVLSTHDPGCSKVTANSYAQGFFGMTEPDINMTSGRSIGLRRGHKLIQDGVELAPEDRPLQRVARSGEAVRVSRLDVVFNDGEKRTIFGNTIPLFDADGSPGGAVGVYLDITQLSKAEEELALAEERFSKKFHLSPAATSISTLAEGRFLDVNNSFLRMLGFTREEVLGKTTYELSIWVKPGVRSRLLQILMETGIIQERQGQVRRKDGAILDVVYACQVITVAGEDFLLTSLFDVTRRKRAEEELRKSREDLRALAADVEKILEKERAYLSRELHDDLGQVLTGFKLDLSWLGKKIPPELTPLHEKIKSMKSYIDSAIERIRSIASELRPGILDQGLIPALEWQVREFEERTGIKCDLKSKIETEPSEEIRIALFRIAQEALTNIMRHSHATRVNIKLNQNNGEFSLNVIDNGRGIPKEAIRSKKSLGILGMRERVYALGGQFHISGNPGTVLSVCLPSTN